MTDKGHSALLTGRIQRCQFRLGRLLQFTPLQQDSIRLLALLLMVGTNIITTTGPHQPVLIWFSRATLPLFALVWGYNLARKGATQRHANRLWLWAVVAQPLYWQALGPKAPFLHEINILFLFAAMTQYLHWSEKGSRGEGWWWTVLSVLLVVSVTNHIHTFDWPEVFVLLLGWGCYAPADPKLNQGWLEKGRPLVVAGWIISVLYLNAGSDAVPAMVSLMVVPAVLLLTLPLRRLHNADVRLLPRHFFPLIYAVYLATLWALRYV